MVCRPALWRIPGLLRPGFAVDHIECRGCVSRLFSRFTCGVFAASLGGVSSFDTVQIASKPSLRVITTAKPVTAGTWFQGSIRQVNIRSDRTSVPKPSQNIVNVCRISMLEKKRFPRRTSAFSLSWQRRVGIRSCAGIFVTWDDVWRHCTKTTSWSCFIMILANLSMLCRHESVSKKGSF